MKRNQWIFKFDVPRVIDAASKLIDYHASRVRHWEVEVDRLEREIKEKGINLRTTARKAMVTNAYQQQVTFDNKLLEAFNEAQDKLHEHVLKVQEYERYQRALLTGSTDDQLELHIEDVEFFGL